MSRRYVFTNSLAAGELAPGYLMRTDAQARNEGAKQMRNVRLLTGGGYRRRPGSVFLAALSGGARLETSGVGEDDARLLVFLDGKFEFRDLDGTLLQALTGCPWVITEIRDIQVAIEDERIIVTSANFWPQLLTKESGVWSIADLPFASGLNGSKLQPYWRFAERGVTLAVSAYTGAVNLVTSDDFFTADHVGARVRYSGIEITITAVTDATHAAGTVVGSLYPTVNVTLVSTAGFLVGQEVEGEDSKVAGVVSQVVSGTVLQVQLTDGYTPFDWTSSTVSEKIVGPTAKGVQGATGPVTAGTPAATTAWDEQMVSAARGYPAVCALHRTRLLLAGFPQAKNAMAASTVGDITDFDVGTGLEGDAIVELVGRETSLGILHFGSTEQLLIFTEAGPHYVPEQVGAPFAPTNFEILRISPEAAAKPVPLVVSEGMLFVEKRSGRLMGVIPTGNVRRSWDIVDLSELGYHLMGSPREIELLPANADYDRLICLLKDDGTIAPLAYRRSATYSAWVQWTTAGHWESVVCAAGSLYCVAARLINGNAVYQIERFDASVYGDGVVDIASPLIPVTHYANQTVSVWDEITKIGEFLVDGSGLLVGLPDDYATNEIQLGFDFQATVELTPPIDPAMGLRPKIRICRADVDVVDSGAFKVNGYDPSGFVNGAGIGGAVELTSGVRRFRPLGRSKDMTLTLLQEQGAPMEVRSVTMEVTS